MCEQWHKYNVRMCADVCVALGPLHQSGCLLADPSVPDENMLVVRLHAASETHRTLFDPGCLLLQLLPGGVRAFHRKPAGCDGRHQPKPQTTTWLESVFLTALVRQRVPGNARCCRWPVRSPLLLETVGQQPISRHRMNHATGVSHWACLVFFRRLVLPSGEQDGLLQAHSAACRRSCRHSLDTFHGEEMPGRRADSFVRSLYRASLGISVHNNG